MTSKEFVEGLIRCVKCAENWGQAPWSDIAGGLKVEETGDETWPSGAEAVRMSVRVHTEFSESADGEEIVFRPSRTEWFTIRVTKGRTEADRETSND